jgi:hypothetical protein
LALVQAWPAMAQQGNAVVNEFRARAGQANYSRVICYTQAIDSGACPGCKTFNGCTWNEFNGSNWHDAGGGAVEGFDFPGDGTIHLVFLASMPQVSSISLIGRPAGPAIANIKWECPKMEWQGSTARITGATPAWASIKDDFGGLTYTCGTTNPSAHPDAKYQYWGFRRN